jgi:hypothetical protein
VTGAALATAPPAGFPFPLAVDRYRYSTNVEPARVAVATEVGGWGAAVIDIDDRYHAEVAERARILAADPTRHAVPPHMRVAAWDAALTLLREAARDHPAAMRLTRTGQLRWRWENDLLGSAAEFAYGDDASLPDEPLRWAASQLQEDVVLLDQRAGQLWVDAGLVTFASGWSFGFDVGMSFLETHGPVPRLRDEGVITRAQAFLARLQPGEPYRRTNWAIAAGDRLDASLETYPEWGAAKAALPSLDDEAFGRTAHLRVEVQHLLRLPDSGAVMFLIRTHLCAFARLATVEPWRRRLAEVLAELPDDMAEYKGIAPYRDRAVGWLRARGACGGCPTG